MKKSTRNFILMMLLGSAMIVAGLASDADGRNFSSSQQIMCLSNDAGKHNSEFWNKFRESVMPEEKPSSDFTGNENPEPNHKKSSPEKN